MASAFAHAVVALTMGRAVHGHLMNRRTLALGVACSILPDVDVIGFALGIDYGAVWGHRGITHSLLFAALVSAALTGVCYRGRPSVVMGAVGLYLFLCTASHGVLDALTNGGLGVAFFAPFENNRYFLPVRPVLVSPIGMQEFFSGYGLRVLGSEAVWIGLPSTVLCLLLRTVSRRWADQQPSVITPPR